MLPACNERSLCIYISEKKNDGLKGSYILNINIRIRWLVSDYNLMFSAGNDMGLMFRMF
jgi:hypothetical protein